MTDTKSSVDTIRAAVIHPSREVQFIDLERDSLEARQEIVGGDIQGICVQHDEDGSTVAVGYINEEGKYQGCAYNPLATLLMHPHITADDFMVGPLIVIGPPGGEDGEDTDLPERTADVLRSLGAMSEEELSAHLASIGRLS